MAALTGEDRPDLRGRRGDDDRRRDATRVDGGRLDLDGHRLTRRPAGRRLHRQLLQRLAGGAAEVARRPQRRAQLWCRWQ